MNLNIIDYINQSKLTEVRDGCFERYLYNSYYDSNCKLSGNWSYGSTLKNSLNNDVIYAEGTFAGCDLATSGTISESASVTKINDNEFACSVNISNVYEDSNGYKVLRIPTNITEIGTKAFYGSSAFSKLIIPNTVTSIGKEAFASCRALEVVEFEANSSITELSENLFYFSRGIVKLTLPDSLETIGAVSLGYTGGIEEFEYGELIIPSGVKCIGVQAFYAATWRKITLNDDLETISTSAFQHIEAEEIIIPDSVTSIEYGCFNTSNYLKKVHFGASITKIPDGCFINSLALEEVSFGGNITSIGANAFKGCTELNKIENLSWSQLTEIQNNAFLDCIKLTGVVTLKSSCNVASSAFNNCDLIYVKE